MRSVYFCVIHSSWNLRKLLPLSLIVLLFCTSRIQAEETIFESRTWTDKKGNQLSATFVDAKNGEVQLKNDAGEVQKFKLADFAEPDQKYLRDLAIYRRKLAAGEKPALPVDPAVACLEIQPWQAISGYASNESPYRKPLLDFPLRVWTDATSGKKVQGKLVTAYNDKVVINVKGNPFDLPITRLSADDQQYVAIQLKGLQRTDLVNVLAKAATTGQSPAAPATPTTPPPTTVAANTPAPAAGNDDIHARLEQLKAQARGNVDQGTQVATATPPAQPNAEEDIQARLARIREMKGQAAGPNPETPPSAMTGPAPAPYTPPVYTPPPEPVTAHYEEPIPVHEPMFRMGKKCMTCNKEVPGHLTAGDKCPHCGVFFGKDLSTGKTAKDPWSPRSIGGLVTIGIAIIAGIGKLISKMSGG